MENRGRVRQRGRSLTLAALRAGLALYRDWWARRPSLTHQPDMTSPKAVERGRQTPAIALPPKAAQCVQWLPRDLWPALDKARMDAEAESACGELTLTVALSWGRAMELRAMERKFQYQRRA